MKEHFKTFGSNVNSRQILIGATGLLIGTLVYLVDRSPDQTYFIYKTGIDNSLFNSYPNMFGHFGSILPAFVHVFAFILITAGVISRQKRGYVIISLSWLILDCAFELGQKYSAWASGIIPDWFGGIPFLENSRSFFLNGTYDLADMAAIIAGTIAAYIILITTNRGGKSYHERGK